MSVDNLVKIGPDPATPWIIIDPDTRTFTRTPYATDAALQAPIIGVSGFDVHGSILLVGLDAGILKIHFPNSYPLAQLTINRDLELTECTDTRLRITVRTPLTPLLIPANNVFKISLR